MRRYTFYLSVALFAFGIGSFVVFKFYLRTVVPTLSIEQSKTSESVQNYTVKDEFPIPSDEQFLKWKMDSFKPVIKKWLKGEKIKQKVELKRDDDWAGITEHEGWVNLLDVNGDEIKELSIETACATVGNCKFWLFQKEGISFRKLLEVDMVSRYSLRKSKNKGYFDIETKSHGSATSGGMAIYKFDGNEYKINKCFGYVYEFVTKKNGEPLYSKDGQFVTKDKPTLTSASCENW